MRRVLLALGMCFLGLQTVSAECVPRIQPISVMDLQSNANARGEFIVFETILPDGAVLEVAGEHEGSPFGGHSERAVRIRRGSLLLKESRLSELPMLQRTSEDPDSDPSDSYRALAFVQACGSHGPVFYITFHWEGDISSPELMMIIEGGGSKEYTIGALPLIDGGIFEVSARDPHQIIAWDSLFEGGCNACKTRYRVSRYVVHEAHPVLKNVHVTHRLYSTGSARFGSDAGVRFAR